MRPSRCKVQGITDDASNLRPGKLAGGESDAELQHHTRLCILRCLGSTHCGLTTSVWVNAVILGFLDIVRYGC